MGLAQPVEKALSARVLLVEDEPALLRSLRRVLQRRGDNVIACASAEEALEHLADESLDVVVTDISMPGMDGMELLRQARAKFPDLPVLLVTGVPSVDTAVEALELGALKYMIKPVLPGDLCDGVDYATRMSRLARAKRAAADYLRGSSLVDVDDTLSAKLDSAIGKLWLAYQPIVSLKQGQVFAFEALVRSDDSDLGNPAQLFEAAERLDRLPELGRAIREQAARTVTELADTDRMFVNLHPRDLLDDLLYAPYEPLSRVAPRVVLELTERMSLDRIPDLHGRLASLRDLGFSLAVDDLGAGYAGLSSFAQIEPEVAKIDMSLTRGVDSDETKGRLMRAMVDLCAELRIDVVVEGVETEGELDALKAIGCDLLQGYYFAKPARELVRPQV